MFACGSFLKHKIANILFASCEWHVGHFKFCWRHPRLHFGLRGFQIGPVKTPPIQNLWRKHLWKIRFWVAKSETQKAADADRTPPPPPKQNLWKKISFWVTKSSSAYILGSFHYTAASRGNFHPSGSQLIRLENLVNAFKGRNKLAKLRDVGRKKRENVGIFPKWGTPSPLFGKCFFF